MHLVEILIEKAAAEPSPGLGKARIDTASAKRGVKLVHTLEGDKVRFNRFDACTVAAEIFGGVENFRLIGGDEEIEAVLNCAFGSS